MRTTPAVLLVLAACASGVDLSGGLQQVQLDDEFCGAAMTSCTHLGRQVVDFGAATVERHTCVEGVDGGSALFGPERGDVVAAHALSAAQLEQVKSAVAGLRVATEEITAYDGAMSQVTVTTGHVTQVMSPGAACGNSPYQRIVDGYPKLHDLVSGL
jgi:hypothetical protein